MEFSQIENNTANKSREKFVKTVEESLLARALVPFFVLAFLLHAVALVIERVFPPIGLLAPWIPNISAIIVLTLVLNEKGGVRRLLGRWTKWRFGAAWYLVAFSPFLIMLFAVGIFLMLGNTPPGSPIPYDWALIVFMLILALITGASGEELGWRGFALPRLQARYNALISSIIVGLMWGFWHLPAYFLLPDWAANQPFWLFTLTTVLESIIITWAVNNSEGSVLTATLFHMSLNFSVNLFIVVGLITLEAILVIGSPLLIGYATIVVLVFGPHRLSKQTLRVDRAARQ